MAQQVDPSMFGSMKWRLIGPFRAGRSLTAIGVPGHPDLFYFGAVGGGVWRTRNAGNTWEPIFDKEPIASIGDIAVAPSDPDVIYVGTGEADMRSDITYGNGMYKSMDGGKTWAHIGLTDTRQIGRVLVDPHNPNLVYVAALGHAYGPNPERGVFRSNDGGKTWSRVLFLNDNTGAIDLAFDPRDSSVMYAAMWQTRRPPWNVYPPSNGPGSGLYKSTDGGSTWHAIKGNGFPAEDAGRIGVAVAPGNPNRVYAIVDAKKGGLYRSDDAGKTWTLADGEARIWSRAWYFGAVTVDPKNADVVYLANIAIYKSTDGGKTFTAFKGAPGGDDYHSVWISPENSQHVIVSSDQGTVITLDGGKTWSSWYNQPTGQFYHASTDDRFPFWIYGSQQDSGSVAIPSRSQHRGITERDWHPVSVGGESDNIAPDPLDKNILFGGRVTRYNLITGQNENISPSIGRLGPFRQVWTLPLTFSQADPHKLYFSYQYLFRTTNGGNTWNQISPDLTREAPPVPPNLDAITARYGLESPRKGVIYAIAPSPLDPNLVWVGTDDGLIDLSTDDGQHWQNVTPKQLTPWSKVGIIEASHFDKLTAYAAVDRHRLDDLTPYIYRTHDGGKSWKLVSGDIPNGAFVNVVREDPERRGLLYAGTELGMYISFDDGDHWQSMQLNLPVTSIRDIAIRDNDLVVATHGRAFWILDNISTLRQLNPQIIQEPVRLFKPEIAYRVRPGSDQATPYPPEIPHGDNPPVGAMIDYYQQNASSTPVTLEILDGKGNLVRRYASNEKPQHVNEKSLRFTMNWVAPEVPLPNATGMHRFVWDVHYDGQPLPGDEDGSGSTGPWAVPGHYTVRLTANGQTLSQPLELKMDPNEKATQADLELQFATAQRTAKGLEQLAPAMKQAAEIRKELKQVETKVKPESPAASALHAFTQKLNDAAGPAPQGYGAPSTPLETDQNNLRLLFTKLSVLESAIESADVAPTQEQQDALQKFEGMIEPALAAWQQVVSRDLPQLNSQLHQAGMSEITAQTKQ